MTIIAVECEELPNVHANVAFVYMDLITAVAATAGGVVIRFQGQAAKDFMATYLLLLAKNGESPISARGSKPLFLYSGDGFPEKEP